MYGVMGSQYVNSQVASSTGSFSIAGFDGFIECRLYLVHVLSALSLRAGLFCGACCGRPSTSQMVRYLVSARRRLRDLHARAFVVAVDVGGNTTTAGARAAVLFPLFILTASLRWRIACVTIAIAAL
jgi:hypothetical protein